MSQANIRVVKKDERKAEEKNSCESEKCVIISPEDLRAYLIERRRAVITELEALNRLLKIQ